MVGRNVQGRSSNWEYTVRQAGMFGMPSGFVRDVKKQNSFVFSALVFQKGL